MSDLPVAYRPLMTYADPARTTNQLWRTLVGAGAIALIYWMALAGLVVGIRVALGPHAAARFATTISEARTPMGLVGMLASFFPMIVAVVFVTVTLHGRPAATLLGPGMAQTARQAFGPLMLLTLVFFPLTVMAPEIAHSTPFMTALLWMPFALPLLAVQITAEELVFRGYLLQQLGARFTSPLIWMGLPSLLFGLLHYAPDTYGTLAFWPVLWATAFGCLAADLTARTGNLGAALAFHFVNNVSALFLVGLYGPMDGLALYTMVVDPSDPATMLPLMLVDGAAIIVPWLLLRVVLRV